MYTDIAWSTTDRGKTGRGNSFCFRFNDDELVVFKVSSHNQEIFQSKNHIFNMMREPYIREDKKADAYLDFRY